MELPTAHCVKCAGTFKITGQAQGQCPHCGTAYGWFVEITPAGERIPKIYFSSDTVKMRFL